MKNRASCPQKLVPLLALSCAMMFSFSVNGQNAQNAGQSPCPATASNGSAGQVLEAEKQNLKNAGKQLGALFKKKPSTPAASTNPCPTSRATPYPPEPAGTPVSAPAQATAGSPQMAATPSTNTTPMRADSIVYRSSLIPPAPPGGLDPTRLPDILGVHIGTSTDQVVKQLNAIYPTVRDRDGLVSGHDGFSSAKYSPPSDKPYIASMLYIRPFPDGCAGAGSCQVHDEFRVIFSGPPEPRAAKLYRSVSYEGGKQPPAETLRNAAIQKYGPNFIEYPPLTLTWAFDEQGKPLPPLPKASSQCGVGEVSPQGFPPPNPQVVTSTIGVPAEMVTQRDIDRIVSARCVMGVVVKAQINALSGGLASGMEITIMELAQDLRNAFAAENYLRQAEKANANQQLKNSQQQAAPSF